MRVRSAINFLLWGVYHQTVAFYIMLTPRLHSKVKLHRWSTMCGCLLCDSYPASKIQGIGSVCGGSGRAGRTLNLSSGSLSTSLTSTPSHLLSSSTFNKLFKCKAIYNTELDLSVDEVSSKHTASGHSTGLFGSGWKHLTAHSKQSSSSFTLSCFHTLNSVSRPSLSSLCKLIGLWGNRVVWFFFFFCSVPDLPNSFKKLHMKSMKTFTQSSRSRGIWDEGQWKCYRL